MFCSKCGKKISKDDKFCPYCGEPVATEVPVQETYTQVPTPTNGFAIAGLVLAFLAPFLGIIFSGVGLSKSKELKGNGRGMALAGLILSILFFVIQLIIIIVLTAIFINEAA